jgi:hypothetical protein
LQLSLQAASPETFSYTLVWILDWGMKKRYRIFMKTSCTEVAQKPEKVRGSCYNEASSEEVNWVELAQDRVELSGSLTTELVIHLI